jgi:hypothetical protein
MAEAGQRSTVRPSCGRLMLSKDPVDEVRAWIAAGARND